MSLISIVDKKNLHNFSKISLNFQNRYQFEINLDKKTKEKKKNYITSLFNELGKISKKINFLDRKTNIHKCSSMKNLLNFINYEQNKECLNLSVIEALKDNSNFNFSNQIRVLFKNILFAIQKQCQNFLNEDKNENDILDYLENVKNEIGNINEFAEKDEVESSAKYLLLLEEFNSSKKTLDEIFPDKKINFSQKIDKIKNGLNENNRIFEKIKKNIDFIINEENSKKIKLCLSLIKKDFESINNFQNSNNSENSFSKENMSLTIKNAKRTFLPFAKIAKKNNINNLQKLKKRSSFNSNFQNSGFYPSENISYNSIEVDESINDEDNLTLFFANEKKESSFKTQKMNKHYSERNILNNFGENIYSENEKNKLQISKDLNKVYKDLIKEFGFDKEIIDKLEKNDESVKNLIKEKIDYYLNLEKKTNFLKKELEILKKNNSNQDKENIIQLEKKLLFQTNTINALEKEVEIMKYNEDLNNKQIQINSICKKKLKDYISKSLFLIKCNLKKNFNQELFIEIFEIINYFKELKADYHENIIKIFDENENLKNELQYVLEEGQVNNSLKQEIIDKFINLQTRFNKYSDEKNIQLNKYNQIFANLELKTKQIVKVNNLKKSLKNHFNQKIKKLDKKIYIKYSDIDNSIINTDQNLKTLINKINEILDKKDSLKNNNNSDLIYNKLNFIQNYLQSFQNQIENQVDDEKVNNLKLKVDFLKNEMDKKKNLFLENKELKEINSSLSEKIAESKKHEDNLIVIIDEYKNKKIENEKNIKERDKKILKFSETERNLKNVIQSYAQNSEAYNDKIIGLEKSELELKKENLELKNLIKELNDKNENLDNEIKNRNLKTNNMTLISAEPSENFKSFRNKNSVSKLSKFSQKKNLNIDNSSNYLYRNFSENKNIVYNNSEGLFKTNNLKFNNEKIRESINYFSNKMDEKNENPNQNQKLEKIINKVNDIIEMPVKYSDLENIAVGRLFNIIETLKLFIVNSKVILENNYDSQRKSLKTPSKLSASMNKDCSKKKKSKTKKHQINKRLEKLTKNYGNISLSKKRFMKIQEDKKKSKGERKIFSMMENKDDKSHKYRSQKSKSKNYNSVLDLVPENHNILEDNILYETEENKDLEKKINILIIKNKNWEDEKKKDLKIITNNEKLIETLKEENNSLKENLDPLINQSNVYIELFQKVRDNCINILQENRENIDNSFESIPKLINSIQLKFENFENVIFSMEEEIEKKNMEIEWLQENLEKLNEKIQNEEEQEEINEEENLNINLNNKEAGEDFNSEEEKEIKDKNFEDESVSLEQFKGEEIDNQNIEEENLIEQKNIENLKEKNNLDDKENLISGNKEDNGEFEDYDEDDENYENSPRDNEEIREAFDKFIKDIFIHSENNLIFIEKIEKMVEDDEFEKDNKDIFDDVKNNGFDIKEKIECLYKNLMEFFKDLDNNNNLSKKQLNEIAQENEFLYEKYTKVNEELERLKTNDNNNLGTNLETNDIISKNNDILLDIIKQNINVVQNQNIQDNQKITALKYNLEENVIILKKNFNLDIKIIKSKQNSVDLGHDLILKENEIQFLKDELNLSNQRMEMYEKKIEEMENKLNKKDDRKTKEKIKKLKLIIKDLEKKLIKAEEIHSEYEQDSRVYIEKIQTLEENINELINKIEELKSQLKNSKSKKNFLKGKTTTLGVDLNKRVKNLTKSNQNLRDKTMFLTEELKKTKLQMKKKIKLMENKFLHSSGHDSSKRMSLKKKNRFYKTSK